MGQRRHVVADGQAEHLPLASLARRFGDSMAATAGIGIYAMRERQDRKLKTQAKAVARPFIKLDRRAASPATDF